MGVARSRVVIRLDLVDRCENFFHRSKSKQPPPHRQMIAEPRLLRNHRPPRREIARTPIRKPPRPQTDILVLRDSEFSPRALDVFPVSPAIQRNGQRRCESPAMPAQLVRGLLIRRGRKFKFCVGPPRKPNQLRKFQILRPIVSLPLIDNVPSLVFPCADRGVAITGR